jgi:hypothetical protein
LGPGPRNHALYRPRIWKGSKPKEAMEAVTRWRLSPRELSFVKLPAKSLQHNVWDAIALGLFFLNKTGVRKALVPRIEDL